MTLCVSPSGDGDAEGGGKEEEGEEGEWEQVGPKNKSTITRQVSWFHDSRSCSQVP